MIDMRESGKFLENGDNCEDTKTQVTEITKESTLSNEFDKELPGKYQVLHYNLLSFYKN